MSRICGFIRHLPPRYSAKSQRERMAGRSKWPVYEVGTRRGEVSREDFLKQLRPGDMVCVLHTFLLADPRSKRRRAYLWSMVDAIEAKGARICDLHLEMHTGDKKQRDIMLRTAVEDLARGRHKRSQGDKRGRPGRDFTPEEIKQAESVWHSRKIKTWADVKQALPKGFSVWRAYKLWGARTPNE